MLSFNFHWIPPSRILGQLARRNQSQAQVLSQKYKTCTHQSKIQEITIPSSLSATVSAKLDQCRADETTRCTRHVLQRNMVDITDILGIYQA